MPVAELKSRTCCEGTGIPFPPFLSQNISPYECFLSPVGVVLLSCEKPVLWGSVTAIPSTGRKGAGTRGGRLAGRAAGSGGTWAWQCAECPAMPTGEAGRGFPPLENPLQRPDIDTHVHVAEHAFAITHVK